MKSTDKGEQGKPDIRRQSKGGDGDGTGNTNHYSEEDRKKRRLISASLATI